MYGNFAEEFSLKQEVTETISNYLQQVTEMAEEVENIYSDLAPNVPANDPNGDLYHLDTYSRISKEMVSEIQEWLNYIRQDLVEEQEVDRNQMLNIQQSCYEKLENASFNCQAMRQFTFF